MRLFFLFLIIISLNSNSSILDRELDGKPFDISKILKAVDHSLKNYILQCIDHNSDKDYLSDKNNIIQIYESNIEDLKIKVFKYQPVLELTKYTPNGDKELKLTIIADKNFEYVTHLIHQEIKGVKEVYDEGKLYDPETKNVDNIIKEQSCYTDKK